MYKISAVTSSLFRIGDTSTGMSGEKIINVYGQVSEAGVISGNGYRYKESFWPHVLGNKKVQESIEARSMVLGTIEHPVDDDSYLNTPYEDASHVVIKAYCEGCNPFAVFGLLNNPKGNAIKALVDLKVPVKVSTRGLGEYDEDNVSEFVEETSYMLITWDFTKNPNFKDLSMGKDKVTDSLTASPHYRELIEMYGVRDSANGAKPSIIKDMISLHRELGILIDKAKKQGLTL